MDEALDPDEEVIPVLGDPVQYHGVGARHPQRGDHRDQHRQDQQRDRATGNPVVVERGNGFGVHDFLAHPQPGEEGRGVAVLTRPVEEGLDVGPVAGGHQQRGTVMISQQQRQVGRRTRGGERHRPDTEVLDAFQTWRVAVGVGGQHDLRTALEDFGAQVARVADDELWAVSGLAQHICAGADADQDGLVFLDEGLEALKVVSGVVLLGDHDDVTAAQFDVDVGNADPVDQQRALASDELNGVAGERFQVGDQPTLGFLHQLGDFFVGALGAADQSAVPGVYATVVQAHLGAVFDLLENVGAGLVDQGDTVGQQHFGSQVRVTARHRLGCVDDGGDLGVDERTAGDRVQVQDMEDADTPGAHPPQQPVDVTVDPGGADNARPRGIAG